MAHRLGQLVTRPVVGRGGRFRGDDVGETDEGRDAEIIGRVVDEHGHLWQHVVNVLLLPLLPLVVHLGHHPSSPLAALLPPLLLLRGLFTLVDEQRGGRLPGIRLGAALQLQRAEERVRVQDLGVGDGGGGGGGRGRDPHRDVLVVGGPASRLTMTHVILQTVYRQVTLDAEVGVVVLLVTLHRLSLR